VIAAPPPPAAARALPLDVVPAGPDDASGIARQLRRCAPETVVLTEAEVRRRWWRYFVARDPQGAIVATVALHPLDVATSELRSLAVDPRRRGSGLGALLVRHVREEARERGRRLVCVTLRPRFFARFGFRAVPLWSVADRPGRRRRPGSPARINGRPRVAMVWSPAEGAPGSEA